VGGVGKEEGPIIQVELVYFRAQNLFLSLPLSVPTPGADQGEKVSFFLNTSPVGFGEARWVVPPPPHPTHVWGGGGGGGKINLNLFF